MIMLFFIKSLFMCPPEINWPKVEHLTKIFRDLMTYTTNKILHWLGKILRDLPPVLAFLAFTTWNVETIFCLTFDLNTGLDIY